MAARNSRGRRRRGRFGFLYKLLSIVLILGAVVAGCIVFFRVESVAVNGNSVYTDEEIVSAAGVEQGDNLFLIWRIPTAQKILKQLPYIKDVNLQRDLPDTLVINLSECQPVGVLKGEDGAWWVMDSKCKLLEQGGSDLTKQYPKITGLTPLVPSEGENLKVSVEESTKQDSLKQILTALEDRQMISQLQSIDMSGISEIHITYEGRFDVRMPMYSDDFHLLVHTLQEVTEYLNAGQIGTIDLTGERARFVPNG